MFRCSLALFHITIVILFIDYRLLSTMSSFSASLSKDKLLEASSDHKFIQMVSNGQITQQQFNTWLAQDYLFVNDYIRLVAHALVNAPQHDYTLLINGLSSLADELKWFEKKLKERSILRNDIKPLSANLTYQRWLDELIQTKKSYLDLIIAVYAIELCYCKAWKVVKNPNYQEFVSRWGSAEFTQFIEQLRVAVDAASITASEDDKKEGRQLWNDIMRLEVGFWNMAINETSD